MAKAIKIPRTKDGKHRLVFPESTFHTYPLRFRPSFIGRRLYEVIKRTSGNPTLARKLDEKYKGRFLLSYPIAEDPEH